MLWPERPDNWRNGALPAQRAFVEVARAISRFEPVSVGVSRAFFESARILLPEHIRVVEMSHDDCWARDVAPTFVVNETGDLRGVHWRFNAWGGNQGGLYAPWDQDELVARKVLEIEGRDRYLPGLINEGGSRSQPRSDRRPAACVPGRDDDRLAGQGRLQRRDRRPRR
jgi:agmatine deiminase